MPKYQLALPGITTLCQLGFYKDPHVVPTQDVNGLDSSTSSYQDDEEEWIPDDPDKEGKKGGWGLPD